jgi:UDP-N-acetylglucosamine 2-epimerase (non-hydrolysing)
MRLLHVIATRPNFVKMAPLIGALREVDPDGDHTLVHTGQHYDRNMSEIFLDELGVPEPDHLLGVGGGSNAETVAGVLERIAPLIEAERPELVIVPGDVNSTLSAALACAHLQVPVAHLEAGLRSFDRTMPEEVNRVLVDQVSDVLFTHSPEALDNLVAEGVDPARVHRVGNTMIDTLVALEDRIRSRRAAAGMRLEPGSYLLVTLHRPALVFPVHPRTRKRIEEEAGLDSGEVRLVDPVGYLDFLSLQADARAVLTDSGGIQEESTYLGIPCFTLRDNTERPITVSEGTNTLLGLEPAAIAELPARLREASPGRGAPAGWDGRAAGRAAERIAEFVNG